MLLMRRRLGLDDFWSRCKRRRGSDVTPCVYLVASYCAVYWDCFKWTLELIPNWFLITCKSTLKVWSSFLNSFFTWKWSSLKYIGRLLGLPANWLANLPCWQAVRFGLPICAPIKILEKTMPEGDFILHFFRHPHTPFLAKLCTVMYVPITTCIETKLKPMFCSNSVSRTLRIHTTIQTLPYVGP